MEEEDQVDEVELSAGEEYHELLLLPLPLLFVVDDCVVSPHQESLLGSLDHDEVDQPELAVVVAVAAAALDGNSIDFKNRQKLFPRKFWKRTCAENA